ncbi:uncharacterized protein EAF02_011863 [Botrytis sinoallii]|uniref:uncharacterized protein n=1 Tax=Botrytis sinoallii TaxID=1463999 RepID=UPI001901BEA2|nr:uncharacterized protein EAF02_011863 [Botrytis sinoallii]KAF7853558.1 hypothetical protein EAF02_011863 [Botrytis sinoallii]
MATPAIPTFGNILPVYIMEAVRRRLPPRSTPTPPPPPPPHREVLLASRRPLPSENFFIAKRVMGGSQEISHGIKIELSTYTLITFAPRRPCLFRERGKWIAGVSYEAMDKMPHIWYLY